MVISQTDPPVASNVVAFAVIGEPLMRSRINSAVAESADTAIITTKAIESQRSPRAVFVIAPGSVAMSAIRRIVSALGNTHRGSGLKRSGRALIRTMTIRTVSVIGHRGSPWTSAISPGPGRCVLAASAREPWLGSSDLPLLEDEEVDGIADQPHA